MGQYAEIEIEIDIDNKATSEQISNFKKEVTEHKDIDGKFTFDKDYCLTLFMGSCRIQNLEYQLEILMEIVKKHKEIILEANGNVMVESGTGFNYEAEE